MSGTDDTPSMQDIAVAHGWLQDNTGVMKPDAAIVESLAWLIAKTRAKEREPLMLLKAKVLSMVPGMAFDHDAFRALQRSLIGQAKVVSHGSESEGSDGT